MAFQVDQQSAIGFDAWIGTARAMPQAHRHGDLEANYLVAGRMTYLVSGRLVDVPLGRLWLVWGAVPHQLVAVEAPATCGWITIPLGQALRWQLPDTLIATLLAGTPVIDDSGDGEELHAIARWSADCRTRGGPWRAIAALEVEARLRRLGLGWAVPNRKRSQPADAGLQQVERMAAFIAAHHTQHLAVATVARQVRLNPTYAMTLFRQRTGMTINGYLTRFRVATAQRLLATSDLGVTEIGLEAGFGSTSRFYEAFASVAGCAPGTWRQEMAISPRPTAAALPGR